MNGKLKIGDLVRCHYDFNAGIGYAKVIKMIHRSTREEYQVYDNIVTGRGDKNSPIDVLVKIVGHHLNDDELSDIILVDENRSMDPHDIYSVFTENDILEFKNKMETSLNKKVNFLYTYVNREDLSGRKILPNMKF